MADIKIIIDGVEYQPCISERKELFVTHDGYSVKDPEEFIYYVSKFVIRERKAKNINHSDNRHFKSYEKAREYIVMNKPMFSINDIINQTSEPPIGTYLRPEEIESFKNMSRERLARLY